MNKKQRKQREKKARHSAHNAANGVGMPGTEGNPEADQNKTHNADDNPKPRKKASNPSAWGKVIEWADYHSPITTLILTVALVYIGTMQACIYRQQLDVARKDQRAWIYLSPADPQVTRDKDSGTATVTWNSNLNNTGKTPGKHISAEIIVEVVDNGTTLTFPYERPRTWGTIGEIPPNLASPIKAMMLHSTDIPNQPQQTVLTPAEYQELADGKKFIVVYGRVSYLDLFGTSHWQHYCTFMTLPAGTVTARNCTDYNDVDND